MIVEKKKKKVRKCRLTQAKAGSPHAHPLGIDSSWSNKNGTQERAPPPHRSVSARWPAEGHHKLSQR